MTNVERGLPSAPKLEVVPTYEGLVAHELANLLPMIEARDFEELKASIAKQGILQPITLYEGKILDGRNRYRAAKEVGHTFVPANFKAFEGGLAAAEEFVIGANINRRQMTNAMKHDVIRKMLEKYPSASNRQIAQRCSMSHVTVAKVRDEKANSPEVVKFKKFKDTWEGLPDYQRIEFVKEFAVDIRDMLGESVVTVST
jgi:hypothetical protein